MITYPITTTGAYVAVGAEGVTTTPSRMGQKESWRFASTVPCLISQGGAGRSDTVDPEALDHGHGVVLVLAGEAVILDGQYGDTLTIRGLGLAGHATLCRIRVF